MVSLLTLLSDPGGEVGLGPTAPGSTQPPGDLRAGPPFSALFTEAVGAVLQPMLRSPGNRAEVPDTGIGLPPLPADRQTLAALAAPGSQDAVGRTAEGPGTPGVQGRDAEAGPFGSDDDEREGEWRVLCGSVANLPLQGVPVPGFAQVDSVASIGSAAEGAGGRWERAMGRGYSQQAAPAVVDAMRSMASATAASEAYPPAAADGVAAEDAAKVAATKVAEDPSTIERGDESTSTASGRGQPAAYGARAVGSSAPATPVTEVGVESEPRAVFDPVRSRMTIETSHRSSVVDVSGHQGAAHDRLSAATHPTAVDSMAVARSAGVSPVSSDGQALRVLQRGADNDAVVAVRNPFRAGSAGVSGGDGLPADALRVRQAAELARRARSGTGLPEQGLQADAKGIHAPALAVSPAVPASSASQSGSASAVLTLSDGRGAAEQLVQQLLQGQARQMTSLRFQLAPAELGHLDVHVQRRGDRLDIAFTASHAGARDLLEAWLPNLKSMLHDVGVQLANVDVRHDPGAREGRGAGQGPMHHDGGHASGQQSDTPRHGGAWRNRREALASALPAVSASTVPPAAASSVASMSGRIDAFA